MSLTRRKVTRVDSAKAGPANKMAARAMKAAAARRRKAVIGMRLVLRLPLPRRGEDRRDKAVWADRAAATSSPGRPRRGEMRLISTHAMRAAIAYAGVVKDLLS